MEAYREELAVPMRGQAIRVFQNNSRIAGTMVAPHWHDACEALFIRRGWGKQRVNAEVRTLHSGDVVLIRPGDIHATDASAPEGMDVDVLQFTGGALADDGRVWQELTSGIVRPEDATFRQLFDAFCRYAADEGTGTELLMTGLVRLFLAFFLRGRPTQTSARSGVIEEICAYIEEARDLRLEQTAIRFGYCPEHLSRRFHAETGMSYRAYCDQIRMKRAAVLLHEADGSVSSVAEQLGYSDDSSFIRAFRRLYGITPSAYRRLCLPVGRQAEQMIK